MPRARKPTPSEIESRIAKREQIALDRAGRDTWKEGDAVAGLLDFLQLPITYCIELTELLEHLCRGSSRIERNVLQGRFLGVYHATPGEVLAMLEPLGKALNKARARLADLPVELVEDIDFALGREPPAFTLNAAKLIHTLASAVEHASQAHHQGSGRLPANDSLKYNMAVPLIEWARRNAPRASENYIDKFTLSALGLLEIEAPLEDTPEAAEFLATARALCHG